MCGGARGVLIFRPLTSFQVVFLDTEVEYTDALGSGFIMRLARFVWSLVSGKIVLATGCDRIFNPAQPRVDLNVFVALVAR